jgi:hypothetical protein
MIQIRGFILTFLALLKARALVMRGRNASVVAAAAAAVF